MDINTLRIAVTLVTFAAFLYIVVNAYMPSRKKQLEKEGRSILEDSDS
jgi:cbb3-type cytochrome oxidase subunit 3